MLITKRSVGSLRTSLPEWRVIIKMSCDVSRLKTISTCLLLYLKLLILTLNTEYHNTTYIYILKMLLCVKLLIIYLENINACIQILCHAASSLINRGQLYLKQRVL